MIFGYSPTRNRTELKRRFYRRYSSNIYRNDFLFRKSKSIYLVYVLFFWILLLLAFRVGSIALISLLPYSGTFNKAYVSLPGTHNHEKFLINPNINYLKISMIFNHRIIVNHHLVEFNDFSDYLSTNKKLKNSDDIFLYIDRSCSMSYVLKLVHMLSDDKPRRIIFVTRSYEFMIKINWEAV